MATAAIDLPDCLFQLMEAEYGACARAHRAIGTIGGALLIQHYATRRADRNHITMVSEASRAYLMHLVPVGVGVTWDMQVTSEGSCSTRFRCAIDVTMPIVVRLLGHAIATPWFVRRHLVEETIGFARDIQRKLQRSAGEG